MRTVLNRDSKFPTNQYTVLSYDTFRLDVYGCEAVPYEEVDTSPGCCITHKECMTSAPGCVNIFSKCSYRGQCCKFNPMIPQGTLWRADDKLSVHNPCGNLKCGNYPAACGGAPVKCGCAGPPSCLGIPNPFSVITGKLGSSCCRQFCCGCCDCIPVDPEGPHRIEFRQYPTSHMKINTQAFCCTQCSGSFSERVVGNLVITATGMAADTARSTVLAIHACQKAWLKKMEYAIPAAKSFTRFEASSTCGTLLVLDSQDPCFTVYGGTTSVLWSGAGDEGNRAVDIIGWGNAAQGPARSFEMSRNECFSAPLPAPYSNARKQTECGWESQTQPQTATPNKSKSRWNQPQAGVTQHKREWKADGVGVQDAAAATDALKAMKDAKRGMPLNNGNGPSPNPNWGSKA